MEILGFLDLSKDCVLEWNSVIAIACFIFKVNSLQTCSVIIDIYMLWIMRPACSKWIHTDQKYL